MRSAYVRNIDWVLLLTVLMLMGMGLLSHFAYPPPNQSATNPLLSTFAKQVTFTVAALGLMMLGLLPSYFTLRRLAYFLYFVCLAALIVLLFLRYHRGARGWFEFGPFKVQPAEFMKIALVLVLARYLMYAKNVHKIPGWIMPTLLTLVPTLLVLIQPDLGTAILFFPAMLTMMFASGASGKHILILVLACALAAPLVYTFGLKDYQQARLLSFLFPEEVAPRHSYQQSQSVRAVASGGLTGQGIGESSITYPFYVPDRHTDFVFSITAQDLGFAGSSLILFLYALLIFQSMRIAHSSRERFGRLVAVGLTTILAMQVFINIGMTLGVAPITGLTLPFMSYGGSSLLTCALMAAILLNIGSRWVPTFGAGELSSGTAYIREFDPGRRFSI